MSPEAGCGVWRDCSGTPASFRRGGEGELLPVDRAGASHVDSKVSHDGPEPVLELKGGRSTGRLLDVSEAGFLEQIVARRWRQLPRSSEQRGLEGGQDVRCYQGKYLPTH